MKKGFTLIELLAVIVILAIIALIATPIVLNIINDTKESAILRSADFYIDALENEIMLENMKQGGNFNPNICTVTNKVITCDGKEINLKVDGEVPTSGSITFSDGKVKDVNLTYQNGNVTLNNKGELVLGEAQKQLAPGLYDKNDNLIASWTELVEKYDFENKVENGGYNYDKNMGEVALVIIENYPQATKLVIGDSVTSIGDHAFSYCRSLKEIIISNSVTSIGLGAFDDCTGLISINIPNSVEIIKSGTFSGCTSLTSIIIPNSVTIIEESAFMDCTSLTSVIIGSGVTSIGSCAFANCVSLTSINIPNSVTSMDGGAFCGCSGLTSIKVDENNKVYDSRDNSNAIIETATDTLVFGCKNTVIPESVTSIGSFAFEGCTSLTSITIPDSVTVIDPAAFNECENLTTIYYKGTATGQPWGAPNAKLETNF